MSNRAAIRMKCTSCEETLTTLDLKLSDDLVMVQFCCPQCHVIFAMLPRAAARQQSGRQVQACVTALEKIVVVEASGSRFQRRGGEYLIAKQIMDYMVTPQNLSLLMERAFKERAAREHAAVLEKEGGRDGNPVKA